jgi:hypothetical protein
MKKLFWRMFWASIPLVILIILIMLFIGYSLPAAALIGLVSGIAYMMTLVVTHRQGIQRRGFNPTGQNLAVTHERTMHLRSPYESTFDLCKEALNRLPGTVFKQEDRSKGSLVARSKMKRADWGERIFFEIQSLADDTTRVAFSSRPMMPTTIVDYGKNLENVERIRSYLTPYEA